MFILPSRSRPDSLRRFLDAYKRTDASSSICVILDRDDPLLEDYLTIDYPSNWQILYMDKDVWGLSGRINQAFDMFGYESYYGLLGDDALPRTGGWDRELRESAGRSRIAYPNDLLRKGELCTHPVIGGDLVRRVGWLALPDVKALYIDTAWMYLGRLAGLLTYHPNVIVEHLHWSADKAPMDATYRRHRDHDDAAAYLRWLAGQYCDDIIKKVRPRSDHGIRNI